MARVRITNPERIKFRLQIVTNLSNAVRNCCVAASLGVSGPRISESPFSKPLEVAVTLSQKLRTFSIVLLFVLSAITSRAQNGPPAHQPRPKFVGPAKWETSAHEASVAYWTLEPGWNTTLEMRNNVIHHDLTVRPVLRENNGQETALTPVTIPPQHVVSLDLRKAALAEGISLGSFGSVVSLRQSGRGESLCSRYCSPRRAADRFPL
jgi:hypothetical protein